MDRHLFTATPDFNFSAGAANFQLSRPLPLPQAQPEAPRPLLEANLRSLFVPSPVPINPAFTGVESLNGGAPGHPVQQSFLAESRGNIMAGVAMSYACSTRQTLLDQVNSLNALTMNISSGRLTQEEAFIFLKSQLADLYKRIGISRS